MYETIKAVGVQTKNLNVAMPQSSFALHSQQKQFKEKLILKFIREQSINNNKLLDVYIKANNQIKSVYIIDKNSGKCLNFNGDSPET